MEQAIQDFLKLREERVPFLGKTYLVSEVTAQASLYADAAVEKQLAEANLESDVLLYWKMFVRSVTSDTLERAQLFTDADIPELARGSRMKLAPLMGAVDRVNGFNAEANAKN